ncbi:hypothetical protein ACG02S_06430 [Roseateles sp. DC23W]|uniref:PXPV repeat-containing protein n=1 Tax=Pelomonas dachongensis TaxID=3299029 RepID=A0ABW7EJ94_9BURK
MLRSALVTLATGAALLGAGAAHAETRWSIGINVPAAGVIVSNAPRYYVEPAPVYYAPPPPVYRPAPRYVVRDVYYAPPPRVVYEQSYRRWDDRGGRWEHRGHDHDRRDGWDRGRDRDDGPHRGR